MNVRPFVATCQRGSAIGTTVLIVALMAVGGQTIARAQAAHIANQRPPQRLGTPQTEGRYWSYPVEDPTAAERAVIAGRVYRAVLVEWAQTNKITTRLGRPAPDVEARSYLELAQRLGPWSLRWQDAQDNAAKSRAARYQALSDHLERMSALQDGRILRETGQANGGPVGPKPPRGSAEVARFFRPIDDWGIDRIIPTLLQSKPPLNTRGVAVTPAEQVEIADRTYHMILADAVDRFLLSPRGGDTRPDEAPIWDAQLGERLAFWSDLWMQLREVAARDSAWRSRTLGDWAARVPSALAKAAVQGGRTAILRSHIERMRELENGHFADDALKRAGRLAAQPTDMSRFHEFAEVARFFRIEAESRLPGASTSNGADVSDSGQAAMAARIYRAILDGGARRYRDAARAGEAPAELRRIFDSLLAERLAAWSIRWARAQIRADLRIAAQLPTIRSHVKRMAALEDGRSLRDALERAGPRVGGVIAVAVPREFADVARFFRLEGLWELELLRAR